MIKNEHQALLCKLKEPFPAADLEWKIQTCGVKKDQTPWARVVAYVTARAIMDRLEDTVGPFGWTTAYREVTLQNGTAHAGIECSLSVLVDGVWITRKDICEPSDVEPLKGAYSGALKRAAVQFGIGRYLYLLEDGFAQITPDGLFKGKTKEQVLFKWNPPLLPEWALPSKQARATLNPPPAAPVEPKGQPKSSAPAPVAPPPPQKGEPAPSGEEPVEVTWRDVIVPPFIKKYSGMTIGEMAEKDAIWWANNYEPKPYRGEVQVRDILFKKALQRAAAYYASQGQGSQPDAPSAEPVTTRDPANTSAEIDDDIPF